MTTSFTLHTQVTKTETVKNRRRVTQQHSNLQILPDRSFMEGAGVLNPGQMANMFGSAEVLVLNSDQPLNISLLDPDTEAVVALVPNTRSYAFDVADTGDSYKVLVEVSGLVEPANIKWFAFDNLTVGSITGTTTMLQQQVNDNIAAIAALQADLVLLQADVTTNTAAIALLQTQLTSLQSQLTALDTTVQANSAALVTINGQLTQIATDISALQAAIAAFQTSQDAQDVAIADLQAARTALEASTAALQTAVATNTGDLVALEARVTADEAALMAADVRLTDLENDVALAEAAIITAQNGVTANGTAITTVTSDLANLTTAVGDNDNEILSLQQLMATTTQTVAENTANIAILADGGWPFSLGKTLELGEIGAFITPYDMKIPAQTTDHTYTRTNPVTQGSITLTTQAGTFGDVTFFNDGTGEVDVPAEIELARGDIVFLNLTQLDAMEAPSFTLITERLFGAAAVVPADYSGDAIDYNGGTEEPEHIEFAKVDMVGTIPPISPRDLSIGEQYTYQFPTVLPNTLGGAPVNPTNAVNIKGLGDPLGSLGIGLLFETDGITPVFWNDPRIVSGNTFTLERVGAAFNLALRFV